MHEEIINEVAEELDLPADKVADAVEFAWLMINTYMNDDRLPDILLREFGTFKPSLSKLARRMENEPELEQILERKLMERFNNNNNYTSVSTVYGPKLWEMYQEGRIGLSDKLIRRLNIRYGQSKSNHGSRSGEGPGQDQEGQRSQGQRAQTED